MLLPSEVFILLGLQAGLFVSVVDAGVTDVQFATFGEIWILRIDSIGVTGIKFANLGSADSKEVTRRSCVAWVCTGRLLWTASEAAGSQRNMGQGSACLIACQ